MSEHHFNKKAYHDPALWAWSEREGRWFRCTDRVIPSDIREYGWDGVAWKFQPSNKLEDVSSA